jgi:hypothetical protein
MKELFEGIWALIWALIVTTLMWSIGIVYSLVYSIYMSITCKDKWMFFKFWWRMIDGFAAALGYLLYEAAYALDLTWNVNGEIIEDIITTEENTTFNQKNISVSASTGKLQIEDKLVPSGKKFSKVLNFFFGQKQHAIDAWNYTKAKKELKEQYFKK